MTVYLPFCNTFLTVLLSSRPWSWSRGQICRSWSWSWTVQSWSWSWHLRSWSRLSVLVLVLLLNKTKDLTNFYCAISATKLWLLYITETHCPRFDMMHGSLDFMQSWNCICICLYQRHLRRLKGCSATVAYLWGHIVPDCVLEVQQALGLLECDCMDILDTVPTSNWAVDVASDSTL